MNSAEHTMPNRAYQLSGFKNWSARGGIHLESSDGFPYTTHQAIGMRYIVTAFVFLLAGGVEALLMRIQLAQRKQHVPESSSLQPGFYGARHHYDVSVCRAGDGRHGCLPCSADGGHKQRGISTAECVRLLDVSCGWPVFLLRHCSRARDRTRDGLLTRRSPGPQFSPGKGVDVWAQMITFTEISSMCVAAELIATIFKMRAPGMSLNRIPMFCWSMLVQSFMIIFAMPAVMIASTFFC